MTKARPLSVEQLVAFNDELAALARAGVPLERGLLALGKDNAGALSDFAAEVGTQLSQGQSLEQLVTAPNGRLPPIYRAVVCAGLRGGRLAVALEGLTVSLRRIADLQRLMRGAAAYPLLVLASAYVLFLFACSVLIPELQNTYESFEVPPTRGMQVLDRLSTTMGLWWPWPPLFLGLWIVWQQRRMRTQPQRMHASRNNRLLTMYRHGRWLMFSDLLALLIEHEVPLTESIPLAAEASGDVQLAKVSHQYVSDLRLGSRRPPPGFPPLIAVTLASFTSPADLVRSLRRIAEMYELRARRDADWLRLYLPALATIIVGGGAVLIATLAFLGPWFHILEALGSPEMAGR